MKYQIYCRLIHTWYCLPQVLMPSITWKIAGKVSISMSIIVIQWLSNVYTNIMSMASQHGYCMIWSLYNGNNCCILKDSDWDCTLELKCAEWSSKIIGWWWYAHWGFACWTHCSCWRCFFSFRSTKTWGRFLGGRISRDWWSSWTLAFHIQKYLSWSIRVVWVFNTNQQLETTKKVKIAILSCDSLVYAISSAMDFCRMILIQNCTLLLLQII